MAKKVWVDQQQYQELLTGARQLFDAVQSFGRMPGHELELLRGNIRSWCSRAFPISKNHLDLILKIGEQEDGRGRPPKKAG